MQGGAGRPLGATSWYTRLLFTRTAPEGDALSILLDSFCFYLFFFYNHPDHLICSVLFLLKANRYQKFLRGHFLRFANCSSAFISIYFLDSLLLYSIHNFTFWLNDAGFLNLLHGQSENQRMALAHTNKRTHIHYFNIITS